MKSYLLLLCGCFLFSSSAHALEQYKCFLEAKSLDRTPVAILHAKKTLKSMKWSLEVLKSVNSNRKILEATVSDRTESKRALYVNKAEGIEMKFYLDGADALGFIDGSIKSPVMNGNIKCMEVSLNASQGALSTSAF